MGASAKSQPAEFHRSPGAPTRGSARFRKLARDNTLELMPSLRPLGKRTYQHNRCIKPLGSDFSITVDIE
jgi:hypothetical protein